MAHAVALLVVLVIGVGPARCPCRVPNALITISRASEAGRPGAFFRSAEGGRRLEVRLTPDRYRLSVALRQTGAGTGENHSEPAPRICLSRTIRIKAGERRREIRVRCRLE
jgi:hypothetical protein